MRLKSAATKQSKKQGCIAPPRTQSLAIELKPTEMAEYFDVHQAARTLAVSTSHVYTLARRGILTRILVLIAAVTCNSDNATRPHPWLLAEQRRLAELSGWKSVPQIKERAVRKAAHTVAGDAKCTVRWKFRREDVLKLKAKRERIRRRDEARARGREVFGRTTLPLLRPMNFTRLRPLPELPPLQQSSPVLDEPQASTGVANIPASSVAKLLAFPTPTQLERRRQ